MKNGRPPRKDGRKPQTQASRKYNKTNYEKIVIYLHKGTSKEDIKRYAALIGKSLNGYINELINNDMKTE